MRVIRPLVMLLAVTTFAAACGSPDISNPSVAPDNISREAARFALVPAAGVAGAFTTRTPSANCWDIGGSTRVTLRPCVTGASYQTFMYTAETEIRYGNDCLAPLGNRGADYDPLAIGRCGSGTAKWTFTAAEEIRSFNNKCLQAQWVGGAGEQVFIMPCTGALIQKWSNAATAVTPPAPAAVSTVGVTLAAATVVSGVGTQATAVLKDSDNNVLTGRSVVWSSSNSAVAAVSQAGVVTTVAGGTANIVATVEGKTGLATLTVTSAPAAVSVVSVSLAAGNVVVGTGTQATAVLRDASNNVLTGRTVVWASTNPAVAAVSSTGAVTTLAAGTVTISATVEGKAGSAALMVTALAPPPAGGVSGYFVATNGTAGGDGTLARPWDIATALAHPARVQSGDTLWIRGGTYKGEYTSYLRGQSGRPVVMRQYPGERAIIDGGLAVRGAFSWFWGFEVMNSSLGALVTAVDVYGAGTKIINMIVHDAAGNGIGLWEGASDAELYGNVLYNVGRAGSTPGRYAHGIYFQNVTTSKRIVDNVVLNSYSYNFHGYTENAGLNNLYLEGNVSFNAGSFFTYGGAEYLIGGGQPVRNLNFTGNYSYRGGGLNARNEFGYGAPTPLGNRITNNYLMGSTKISYFDGGTFTGNTFANRPSSYQLIEIFHNSSQSMGAGFVFNNNTYRAPNANNVAAFRRVQGTGRGYSFAEWRAFGYDANSDFQIAGITGTKAVVRPNLYEAGRANVVVYNWDQLGSVMVDLSGVLAPGSRYEVREVQDYFGSVVASGTSNGGMISLPMSPVTAVRPLGPMNWAAPSTGTEFHTFVVLRKP